MEPSPGNNLPSCPVTMAPGMRKVMNPRIRYVMDTGPLPKNPVVFVIKSTMATKIATMSKVLRTLGRIPPATRSETRPEPSACAVAIAVAPLPQKETYQHSRSPTCNPCRSDPPSPSSVMSSIEYALRSSSSTVQEFHLAQVNARCHHATSVGIGGSRRVIPIPRDTVDWSSVRPDHSATCPILKRAGLARQTTWPENPDGCAIGHEEVSVRKRDHDQDHTGAPPGLRAGRDRRHRRRAGRGSQPGAPC